MREMKESTYDALKNRNMTGAARFNHEIEIEGFVPSGGAIEGFALSGGAIVIEGFALSGGEFAGGSGTTEDPYIVASPSQLDDVRNHPSASFKQTMDIDLVSIENWMPIFGFSGNYDGQGFTISNLKMNHTAENTSWDGPVSRVGLFRDTDAASLSNINLSNVDIETNKVEYVGSLVGYSEATNITNCSSSGNIKILSDWGSNAGGLIGAASNDSGDPDITIVGCHSSVNISGILRPPEVNEVSLKNSGGFVGMTEGGGVIIFECCFATGNVKLMPYDYNDLSLYGWGESLGGFVGFPSGSTKFRKCYASGNVRGTHSSGGFVGQEYYEAEFENCYSRGSVEFASEYMNYQILTGGSWSNTESDFVGFGGFGGDTYTDATATNCYSAGSVPIGDFSDTAGFRTNGSGTADCYYDSTNAPVLDSFATGKPTAEMKTQSTFAGWDFDTIWKIDPAVNDGYPYLRCGEQTDEEPETPQVANHIFKARSININKSNAGASTAAIVVNNKDGIANPRNPYGPLYGILNLNKKISIKQGYGDDLIPSFTGIIDSIEMSTWPQVATIQLRDNLKRALDQTVTKGGKNVVAYAKQPIEDIVTDLCGLCGLDIGTVDETGISIETEFNWQTYGDAFQNLADLASFEFFVDEAGLFYFRRDHQPNDMEVAWSFEEGVDITDLSYTLDDNDLYHAVRVYGKDESDNVLVYNALFVDAPEFNILPQKILKIDATEAATMNELAKIAQRALATMRSRSRVISFSTVAIPHLQKGDFIQIFESSTNTHEIYRLSSIALRMDSKSFTMQCQAYYYGDSIVLGEIPEDIAFQVPDANLNLIPQMTSNTTPYGVARSSSVYKLYGITYSPWRSFNDAEFDWFWDISTVQGWIEYEFPLRHIIDKYSVKAREDLVWNKAIPKDWAFEAFDGEKWIELDRQTGHTNWGIYEERSFNFDNTTPYAKYRLRVIANNGYKRSQLEQLKMFYRGGV